MAMEGNDPTVSSAAQTSTLVESLLYFYDDDTASSSTVVITFSNSAAASSWTSEDSWFEQLPAAATTTAAAQTSTTAVEVVISAEKQSTITTYVYPTSPTSSSTSPTFTPAANSTIPQSPTDVISAPPLPSPHLSSSLKTGISIGASLGFLSLALLLFSIYRYLKHKQRSRQMHAASIPPILPSCAVDEAEKRVPTGSQELGSTGYGANGAAQISKEEGRDGLASLHELGGVSALNTPRELSGVSSGEFARDSGVRSVVGRTELA